MMNKAIECEEADANQHTACLGPDQIAIDDSHKVISEFNSFYFFTKTRFIDKQTHSQA